MGTEVALSAKETGGSGRIITGGGAGRGGRHFPNGDSGVSWGIIYEHVTTNPIPLFGAGLDGQFGTGDDPLDPVLWLVTARHVTDKDLLMPGPATALLVGLGGALLA
jgi:hypothetical protein